MPPTLLPGCCTAPRAPEAEPTSGSDTPARDVEKRREHQSHAEAGDQRAREQPPAVHRAVGAGGEHQEPEGGHGDPALDHHPSVPLGECSGGSGRQGDP
ncbi:hypothetical protein [Streptomyces sp. NPDC046161]|uniref:hypothetical protein n=1 Tax=Streptomyces sp. NPDC046161 TaxID=3155132 RepID=UPI00340F2352